MLTHQLEHLFLEETLQEAFSSFDTKSKGLDDVSMELFQRDLQKNIQDLILSIVQGEYQPEPIKKIEIFKEESKEKRPIGISSIKDKLVQKVLANSLNHYYDKTFLDNSYGYRIGKSVSKGVNRISHFLNQGNQWILKTDIDNFFETINHTKLLELLKEEILDKRIVNLIELLLKNGGFKTLSYEDHLRGVHQGDSLSPVLSNIYLHQMDLFLKAKEGIEFVRFADDFVLFAHKKEPLEKVLADLKEFLRDWNLTLEESKTKLLHHTEEFTFLGVTFKEKERYINNDRFYKTISKLHKKVKKSNTFLEAIKDLNTYIQIVLSNYQKILPKESKQLEIFHSSVLEALSTAVFKAKEKREITKKEEFEKYLTNLDYFKTRSKSEIDFLIDKAYEKLRAKVGTNTAKEKINKKKKEYSKKLTLSSTAYIGSFGTFLGINKTSLVAKIAKKQTKKYPLENLERVIIASRGISLSSDLIMKLANKKIPIEFITKNGSPYAMLTTVNSSVTTNAIKQLDILKSPNHLQLAKEFLRGKGKNQINYIKYLNKYHKTFSHEIVAMEKILKQQKLAKDIPSLMGYEGALSNIYWSAIGKVLDEDVGFSYRETKGAKDLFNSALNYGYAFLYSRVQNALIQAGLSLHVSFLHSIQENKPTLVYDAIEEFRTFVVDRTIVSMFNKQEKLSIDSNGFLDDKSRKLIAKNLTEQFANYTMWKKQSVKIDDIIKKQAYLLAKHIKNEEKYKAFIGKY